MTVDRCDSPAGWLLQGPRFFVFVGACLQAICGAEPDQFAAKNRRQAGSYKEKIQWAQRQWRPNPGEYQCATAVTGKPLSVVCHADFVQRLGRQHEGQRAHGRRERQQGEAQAVVAGQIGEHACHHGASDLPHGNHGS